ncbi:tryptophanyl-tRNA synthetase [Parcubacteria bacterium DG_74_2]|nr:MAG: tryptophanyl-tRNA synthetase [Parcubacteria bacterium DG_74_2]
MRVFSGVRPTGELHIGNYLGAIKQWLELQKENECLFCIVDLHAITTPYEKKSFQKNILELATAYLAAGLDPEKCILFIQSQIKEHSELAWVLGTICPLGELKRMTQFKEKAKKYPKYVNAGLLNYPLLMASDILLYKTDLVPVGKDQKQHVELTQFLAEKFNRMFGKTFKVPKPLIPKIGAKIMSLQNPKKKMSKTDDPEGCIEIFEEPATIERKVMSAVTDSGKKIKYDPIRKPGISNLLTVHSLFSGKSIKSLEKESSGMGYEKFKKSLVELLINSLKPFRQKKKEILKREVFVREILERGRKRAQTIAKSTMEEVKRKMGLSINQ